MENQEESIGRKGRSPVRVESMVESEGSGAVVDQAQRVGEEERASGTLTLVLLFGLLLVAIWLIVYFGIFVARG